MYVTAYTEEKATCVQKSWPVLYYPIGQLAEYRSPWPMGPCLLDAHNNGVCCSYVMNNWTR